MILSSKSKSKAGSPGCEEEKIRAANKRAMCACVRTYVLQSTRCQQQGFQQNLRTVVRKQGSCSVCNVVCTSMYITLKATGCCGRHCAGSLELPTGGLQVQVWYGRAQAWTQPLFVVPRHDSRACISHTNEAEQVSVNMLVWKRRVIH